jgi:hypothetical protein
MGCESYWERKELTRERRQLEERRQELQRALDQAAGGKTQFTKEEQAVVGPIAIELRRVEGQLAEVDRRLSNL